MIVVQYGLFYSPSSLSSLPSLSFLSFLSSLSSLSSLPSLLSLLSLPSPRLNSFCVSAHRLRCLYSLGKRSKWPVADKKDWCVRIFKLFFVSLRGYCIY